MYIYGGSMNNENRTSNPVFNNTKIMNTDYVSIEKPMTISGAMDKLLILTIIMMISAAAVHYQFTLKHLDYVRLLGGIGILAGAILGWVIAFWGKTAPCLSPIYAFCEGAALAYISCFTEAKFPGIVIQAISMTFLVLLTMAVLYKTKLIRATQRFKSTIITATIAICIFYLIAIICYLLGFNSYFSVNTPLAIGINIVIAIIASLNLILDFDFIEQCSNRQSPAYFEWYCAFGLLVTIVWIYVEILRLLARFRSR